MYFTHMPPIENIKHRPTSSQININPLTKDWFTSVPIVIQHIQVSAKKLQDIPKGKNKQPEETKYSSEPDSEMTQIQELLDKGFKITIINMWSTLMEKVYGMQEQMVEEAE